MTVSGSDTFNIGIVFRSAGSAESTDTATFSDISLTMLNPTTYNEI